MIKVGKVIEDSEDENEKSNTEKKA